MTGLHAIAYTSRPYRALTVDELGELLESARSSNERMGVTGVLFHHLGQFFHYIEGEASAVASVYASIVQSTRHHDLRVLFDAPVATRQFESWYMGFCEPPENALQAIATADWINAMPLTRSTLEKSEAMSIVLSYWSRWVADRPRNDAGPFCGRLEEQGNA
jgi:Sensors of blue-light using FAD